MSNPEYIDAILTEIEPFEVEMVEKELISVNFTSIDTIFTPDEISIGLFVYNESPTKMTSIKFQTDNEYRPGKISVFLYGLKFSKSDVTENSSNTFTISIPTISTDTLEVNYIKII